MKNYILLLLISFLCGGAINKNHKSQSSSANTSEKEIPIYNFNDLESFLYTKSEKTYLVNFWAMWCAPCVKELPIILEYEKRHPEVEVLLVSLDFPNDIESKLRPFLKKKGITSKVVLLDDPDANSWIDKIDPNWSGSIPFTIVFNKEARSFHERAFESIQDLENVINKTIN
jgi:thiol-disulfide isomerase/thioredoxin